MVLPHSDGGCSDGNLNVVAGPVLLHERVRIELQHHRLIRSLAKQARSVETKDGAIVIEIIQHGSARIEQEASADRKVLVWLEHDNTILPLSVIHQRKIAW